MVIKIKITPPNLSEWNNVIITRDNQYSTYYYNGQKLYTEFKWNV